MFIDAGGLVLLLYIDHNATRDISSAFNASLVNNSGLCEPVCVCMCVQKNKMRIDIGCTKLKLTYVSVLWAVGTFLCIQSFVARFHAEQHLAFGQAMDRPLNGDENSVRYRG